LHESGKPIDKSILLKLYALRGGVRNQIYEDIDKALSDYRKSINIAEELKRAGEPFDEEGLAIAYMGIAQSYDQKEEFCEANENYNECIEIWERLRSEGKELKEEGNLAIAYMNRGANHCSLGDNGRALEEYSKSIILMNRLKQDVFNVVRVYRNRARVYKADGNIRLAIDDIIAALRALKEVFSESPESQEYYYDYFNEAIEWVIDENDKTLYNSVVQEFLHSMRSVCKTEEAEAAQNNILERLREFNESKNGGFV